MILLIFLAKGAVAGENFKNVDKYWGIWYSVLYGMQEMCWINFNMGCFEIITIAGVSKAKS